MPEPVTAHFEVNTKIVHNFDVISEVLRCGEMGEPTALMAFREVNPPTPWSRCSHEPRGVSGSMVRVTGAQGRREQDVRQVQADPPCLCRENKLGRDRSICVACIESAPRQQRQRQIVGLVLGATVVVNSLAQFYIPGTVFSNRRVTIIKSAMCLIGTERQNTGKLIFATKLWLRSSPRR